MLVFSDLDISLSYCDGFFAFLPITRTKLVGLQGIHLSATFWRFRRDGSADPTFTGLNDPDLHAGSAFQGGITVPAYAAAKGGVAQLTKALANEWAEYGINVNAIAPGYMSTDNTAPLRADETRNRQILERIPAGRWGAPADLAGAALFLSSAASDYVHGHVLVVDGGWLGR